MMNLGQLIDTLAAHPDQNAVLPRGFTHPHSYRGYYECLAFAPAADVTVRDMLAAARRADGTTHQGWKGGDYRMDSGTDVYLAEEGSTGDELSALLLDYMLAAASPSTATPADLAALARELDEAIEDVSDGKGADAEKALDRIATCLRAHRCAPAVEVANEGCTCTAPEPDIDCAEHGDGKREERAAAPPAEGEAASGDVAGRCEECGGLAEVESGALALHVEIQDGAPVGTCSGSATERFTALRDASPAVEVDHRALIPSIEWALFGTEDGTLLSDDEATVPLGELRRLLREEWDGKTTAPEPARPLAVGDTVTTVEELDALPARAVVVDSDGDVGRRHDNAGWDWLSHAVGADACVLPARVLDLPGATS